MKWQTVAPLIAAAIMAASGTRNVQAHVATAQTVKIRRVVLESGNPGKTLNSGYTTMQQSTVSCSYYSNCTFAMSIMANVGEATCKEEWAIIGLVDGNSVDGGPLVEELPGNGNTQTHVWQGVYSVPPGYHTLTFQLYLPCAANANQWSVRYLIAKP